MYRQIGEVITRHATKNNLSVVRSYCGHGIGMFVLHSLPEMLTIKMTHNLKGYSIALLMCLIMPRIKLLE